ncbi:transmembrane protein 246 [Trichomycterus rosablanca]|uniref:transmembrane protein 246 n=1 Tax=Trichomycterus rosablanca TaxID=2290929 RepID=UPI002F35970E
MRRWKVALQQHMRAHARSVTCALAVCVLTFGVILPLCCHRCLYSYYFLKSLYLDQLSDEALQRSYERGQAALQYWKNVSHARPAEKIIPEHPELLVTVVTAQRTMGQEYHYLLQVMQKLKILRQGCGEAPCAEVLVCNVESGFLEHEDAALVEKQFLMVKQPKGTNKDVNIFEKEKRDYVFCLRKSMEMFKPRNLLMLEDDALPRSDFFAIIRNLLSRRFISNSLYVKLYHPERLQRYWNPEPYRILEWVGLGIVVASTILFFLAFFTHFSQPFSVPFFFILVVYFMVGAELIGRHYLLELRRMSPQLYAVSPATECCTPAMLFPGNTSSRVAALLDATTCVKGNAKDIVLYRQASHAHSLEPNAVQHIGTFSSIRLNPSHPRLL